MLRDGSEVEYESFLAEDSVWRTGEKKAQGSGGKKGGLLEMLMRLNLADRYLQKLECEEIDLGTLQETLAMCGRPALLRCRRLEALYFLATPFFTPGHTRGKVYSTHLPLDTLRQPACSS
jgi:hypothetical protein